MSRIGIRFRDDRLPFSKMIGIVRHAEAQGVETLFVPEASGRELFTQLGAYAVSTSRIRLSPGIATIFTRSPALLAQAAATLDQVSGGRAALGLGTGHAPVLTAGHGVHFTRPASRMQDYVALIRAILRGDRELPATTTIQVSQFRLESPPTSAIPIYVAALGPRMCQIAGALADGVLLNWATPAYVERALANIRVGAEHAGRDPAAVDVACYVRVGAGADTERTRHELSKELARYIHMPFYRSMFEEAGFTRRMAEIAAAYEEDPDRAAALVPEDMLEALTVANDVTSARARLEQYRQMGVTLPVAAPVPAGADRAASWRAAIDLVTGPRPDRTPQ